ncbi:MAG: hypothetical protein JNL70_08090 [Saprospiraceae bacterium]|nr:hypothetical protein [Saprospiraceae bacterium]
MNRYLVIGLVIVTILGLFFWLGQRSKNRINWQETYEEKSKEPYGTFIMHDILRGYLPTGKLEDLKEKVSNALPTEGEGVTTANYVFIGDGFFTDTADLDKLMLFVHNGGRAFISTNAVPNYFLKRISYTVCDTVHGQEPEDFFEDYHSFKFDYGDTAKLNFKHPQLYENHPFITDYVIRNEPYSYPWSYIDTLESASVLHDCPEKTSSIALIGTFDHTKINFIKVNYGKGAVLLHTTPLVFSNIQLLDSSRLRYAEKAFSHLQNGIIYWDTKSRVARDVINRMNGSNIKLDKDSPLKYVLAQPSLRWAWFLFLGLVAAYLIFVAKRRQRIIPVLEEKTNTSLQFIKTIGLMYFRQDEQVSICDMKMKQFQTFVRERYKLLSRNMDDEFVKALALKSGISDSDVRAITLYEKRILHNDITEDVMIEFHHLLNRFYKNCK